MNILENNKESSIATEVLFGNFADPKKKLIGENNVANSQKSPIIESPKQSPKQSPKLTPTKPLPPQNSPLKQSAYIEPSKQPQINPPHPISQPMPVPQRPRSNPTGLDYSIAKFAIGFVVKGIEDVNKKLPFNWELDGWGDYIAQRMENGTYDEVIGEMLSKHGLTMDGMSPEYKLIILLSMNGASYHRQKKAVKKQIQEQAIAHISKNLSTNEMLTKVAGNYETADLSVTQTNIVH